jgi:hypothetical protein
VLSQSNFQPVCLARLTSQKRRAMTSNDLYWILWFGGLTQAYESCVTPSSTRWMIILMSDYFLIYWTNLRKRIYFASKTVQSINHRYSDWTNRLRSCCIELFFGIYTFLRIEKSSQVIDHQLWVLHRATAQSRTRFFCGYAVAEAPPVPQAGWSDLTFS